MKYINLRNILTILPIFFNPFKIDKTINSVIFYILSIFASTKKCILNHHFFDLFGIKNFNLFLQLKVTNDSSISRILLILHNLSFFG